MTTRLHGKQHGHVAHRAPHRTFGTELTHELVAHRPRGNATGTRPEAEHVVVRGGVAQRSHEVAAVGHRLHAQRETHRRAAARSARRARRVPGIARDAEHRVVRVRAQAEFGRVGLADHDAAGALHARDHEVVEGGNVVGEERRAERGANAGGGRHVLDRHRKPVEHAAVGAGIEFRVARVGLAEQPFPRLQADDRVVSRIERVDAIEVRPHDLAAGNATRMDRVAEAVGSEREDRIDRFGCHRRCGWALLLIRELLSYLRIRIRRKCIANALPQTLVSP